MGVNGKWADFTGVHIPQDIAPQNFFAHQTPDKEFSKLSFKTPDKELAMENCLALCTVLRACGGVNLPL